MQTAVQYLDDRSDIEQLYLSKAAAFKVERQWKSAESAFLAIDRVDLAAEMYKDASRYADYLRLMQRRPAAELVAAQTWVAQQHEAAGHFRCAAVQSSCTASCSGRMVRELCGCLCREAEAQYCLAGAWKAAVKMYRRNDRWEDVIRVAKAHGGPAASKQVAYAWAVHLEADAQQGPAAKVALLKKMGLMEYAMEYACETGDFAHAFQLAEQGGATAKLPEMHLKHAMHLEVRFLPALLVSWRARGGRRRDMFPSRASVFSCSARSRA